MKELEKDLDVSLRNDVRVSTLHYELKDDESLMKNFKGASERNVNQKALDAARAKAMAGHMKPVEAQPGDRTYEDEQGGVATGAMWSQAAGA